MNILILLADIASPSVTNCLRGTHRGTGTLCYNTLTILKLIPVTLMICFIDKPTEE